MTMQRRTMFNNISTLVACAILLHSGNTIKHTVDAFVIVDVVTTVHTKQSSLQQLSSQQNIQNNNHYYHLTTLYMAGFGDTSSSNTVEVKLKPKQQWDRYIALKKEKSIKVGVKVIVPNSISSDNDNTDDDATSRNDNNNNNNNWLEVGAVKCDPSISTDVAVARQRALIVEHAKRLYPLKISPKAQIEWGYQINTGSDSESENDSDDITNNDINSNWITVDKTVLDSIPLKGIEKLMGFEGTPDPTTGFYCVYNEGRLVKATDTASSRPSSKKLG